MGMFPDYVMIETTSLCNASCIMCPHPETSKEKPQGNMRDDLFRKIIDECSRFNNVKKILLYLFNEPLMDKNIAERIDYAKTKNPMALINIVSNGNLLNEEMTQKILRSKLDYIEFSVHGIKKDTYERIMRKLDFSKTMNSICRFIDEAKKCGKHPGYINIKILGVPGVLEKEEILLAERFWKSKGVLVSYFLAPISRSGNVRWMNRTIKNRINGCGSIWRDEMIHIIYNGDVVLCCMDWRREVTLGNLNNSSIYDIWNGDKKRETELMISGKSESPDGFICKRCEESL
ncbi:MAG: radical SAM protein [Candidatus Woesearchaeota archaeon]|nr:radical SAM protein [Candidatus Woesearchaeota archaeon]